MSADDVEMIPCAVCGRETPEDELDGCPECGEGDMCESCIDDHECEEPEDDEDGA